MARSNLRRSKRLRDRTTQSNIRSNKPLKTSYQETDSNAFSSNSTEDNSPITEPSPKRRRLRYKTATSSSPTALAPVTPTIKLLTLCEDMLDLIISFALNPETIGASFKRVCKAFDQTIIPRARGKYGKSLAINALENLPTLTLLQKDDVQLHLVISQIPVQELLPKLSLPVFTQIRVLVITHAQPVNSIENAWPTFVHLEQLDCLYLPYYDYEESLEPPLENPSLSPLFTRLTALAAPVFDMPKLAALLTVMPNLKTLFTRIEEMGNLLRKFPETHVHLKALKLASDRTSVHGRVLRESLQRLLQSLPSITHLFLPTLSGYLNEETPLIMKSLKKLIELDTTGHEEIKPSFIRTQLPTCERAYTDMDEKAKKFLMEKKRYPLLDHGKIFQSNNLRSHLIISKPPLRETGDELHFLKRSQEHSNTVRKHYGTVRFFATQPTLHQARNYWSPTTGHHLIYHTR